MDVSSTYHHFLFLYIHWFEGLSNAGDDFHFSLTPRLLFFYHAIAAPEEIMADNNVSIGIIGMARTKFDTMLRILPPAPATDGKSRTMFV